MNDWLRYSLRRMSDWRKDSYFFSDRVLALRYSIPRIPARPENSTALNRFLYPMIHLAIINSQSSHDINILMDNIMSSGGE